MDEIVQITRLVEFDAGHRIPYHKSKCRNVHGHRYKLIATVEGPIISKPDQTDTGMVVDFGDLKRVMMRQVAEPWDHSFLVYAEDNEMMSALRMIPDHRTVVLNFVPTAENLAKEAYRLIDSELRSIDSQLRLISVELFETPNCSAKYPV